MNLGRLSPADQLLAALPLVGPRLLLSRAKHRSLAGHSRMAKRLARWIPGYTHSGDAFFTADGASDATVARRKAGFAELAQQLQAMAPRSLAATAEARPGLPDLQLTSQYRVPYPFSEMARAVSVPRSLRVSDCSTSTNSSRSMRGLNSRASKLPLP